MDGQARRDGRGIIGATYKNSTHRLSWSQTGGNLHFYKVQACLGLISSGDPAALIGSFSVSPPQSITSP